MAGSGLAGMIRHGLGIHVCPIEGGKGGRCTLPRNWEPHRRCDKLFMLPFSNPHPLHRNEVTWHASGEVSLPSTLYHGSTRALFVIVGHRFACVGKSNVLGPCIRGHVNFLANIEWWTPDIISNATSVVHCAQNFDLLLPGRLPGQST